MKLFVNAYEAMSSYGVDIQICTDKDLEVEAARFRALKKNGDRLSKRLLKFIEECHLYDKIQFDGEVFMCIDEDFGGPTYLVNGRLAKLLKVEEA